MMDGWGRFSLVGLADIRQQNVRPVNPEINCMTLKVARYFRFKYKDRAALPQ